MTAAADGHVDLIYMLERHAPSQTFRELQHGAVTPASVSQGGLVLLICALYCEDRQNGSGRAWARLQDLMRQADWRLAGLPRHRPGMAVESGSGPAVAFLLENGDALIEADWDLLENWGLRTVGLTHSGSNRLADGNAVAAPQGLSPDGRSVVKRLARRGWILDFAHLAPVGFYQALELFEGQVVCSHTGLRRFCDRPRNLDDTQLGVLVAAGGVVGLSPAPEMLTGGAACRADLVKQIDWLVQRFGPQAVALGSDYGGFEGVCVGFEDHSRWPLLADDLKDLGYSGGAVRDILFGNWLRVYGA